MQNQWSDSSAAEFVNTVSSDIDAELALRLYSSRLLGSNPALVLHGGGNCSVKSRYRDLLGRYVQAIFIKASGHDMAKLTLEGLPGLRRSSLQELQAVEEMDDATMVNQLRSNLFDAWAPTPSIEALLHTFLPAKFIDHTHADAILTLSNQKGGEAMVRQAMGDQVIILPYVHPGFALAKAAADAFAANPTANGMVMLQHGLITWGDDAKTAYDRHIELVNRAEEFAKERATKPLSVASGDLAAAKKLYRQLAPQLRGGLAAPSNNPDRPHKRFILKHLNTQTVLAMLEHPEGQKWLLTPPLTSDHLIRCKPLPVWVGEMQQIEPALIAYRDAYSSYCKEHGTSGQIPYDSSPRVALIPGVGGVCAAENANLADMVRDITQQTVMVKHTVAAMGGEYEGLADDQLFAMEYYELQQNKLAHERPPPLAGSIGLVTGAAGAIGAGICRELLANGCHVAATDLPGDPLDDLVAELSKGHPGRIIAVPMDVTNPEGVTEAFGQVIDAWGGVDIVIVNAGLAHVCSLTDMDIKDFQRLQRVNIEGTLNVLSESGRLLKQQGTGGDIILISTKNVFAPGANFGAYSATKAASHQLARIASLEMAAMDVRVNMVAPDAVFSEGSRKSELWAEVGPDRMKARGLDEAGLEAYYQNRNLLKAAVTARHVANAVLYFVTRQSPTTGATLPVDGGLPDATPR